MNKGLIYSTDHGAMCPECGRPAARCECSRIRKAAVPLTDGIVRVRFETHGRGGKRVTVIRGLPLSEDALVELPRKFKQRFGTGGTVNASAVEIQGDHRDQIVQELRSQGYTVR